MTDKKKIIVADDDPAILDVTKMILEDYGSYEVKIIEKADQLLKLSEELPDLILLDLWLSGQNGKDICISLKEDERTKKIPVILFSANRDLPAIASNCGANDYLPKPFQMKDLLEKVDNWIKK